jgi:hypothetical protein
LLEKSRPTLEKLTASRVALGKGQRMVRSVCIVTKVVIKTTLGKSHASIARLGFFKVRKPNLFVYIVCQGNSTMLPVRRSARSVNVIFLQVKRDEVLALPAH